MVKLGHEIKRGPVRRDEFFMVVSRKEMLGSEYRRLVLELPVDRAEFLGHACPGQFVEIACGSHGGAFLRRPFSIASLEHETNDAGEKVLLLEIIHNVIGPGTQWMAGVEVDSVVSVLGPLGNGFELPEKGPGKSLLVGGGVGVPPMLFLADRLGEIDGHEAVGFAGIRSKSHFEHSICFGDADGDHPLNPRMLLEPFNRSKTASVIATDDGSFGFAGNVVEALDRYLDENPNWQEAEIFGCGPEVMLKALASLAAKREMECQVCLEAYMACGFGVCQSCVVSAWVDPENADRSDTNRHYMRVCDEGPVFDAKKIVWE
jgi:dihydroorotate dehydrogenase electron transfer subunit